MSNFRSKLAKMARTFQFGGALGFTAGPSAYPTHAVPGGEAERGDSGARRGLWDDPRGRTTDNRGEPPLEEARGLLPDPSGNASLSPLRSSFLPGFFSFAPYIQDDT